MNTEGSEWGNKGFANELAGLFVGRLVAGLCAMFLLINCCLPPTLAAQGLNCMGGCNAVQTTSVKLSHPLYPGCLFFLTYVKYQCIGGKVSYWVQSFGPVNPNDPGCSGWNTDVGTGSNTNWTLVTWMFNSWYPILAKHIFNQDPNAGFVTCPSSVRTYNFKQASCTRIYGYVANVVFEDFTTVAQAPHYGILQCGQYCCEIGYDICVDPVTNKVITHGRLVDQNFVSCAQIVPPEVPEGSNYWSNTCIPACVSVVQE
ncbi:MAG: hypothetical protein HQ472_01780 [Ignavibacteria bacterium]|nr:hypothetical protein [Ignavibacteria bacterium]